MLEEGERVWQKQGDKEKRDWREKEESQAKKKCGIFYVNILVLNLSAVQWSNYILLHIEMNISSYNYLLYTKQPTFVIFLCDIKASHNKYKDR